MKQNTIVMFMTVVLFSMPFKVVHSTPISETVSGTLAFVDGNLDSKFQVGQQYKLFDVYYDDSDQAITRYYNDGTIIEHNSISTNDFFADGVYVLGDILSSFASTLTTEFSPYSYSSYEVIKSTGSEIRYTIKEKNFTAGSYYNSSEIFFAMEGNWNDSFGSHTSLDYVRFSGLSISDISKPVPEPSTVFLFAIGLLGFAAVFRTERLLNRC